MYDVIYESSALAANWRMLGVELPKPMDKALEVLEHLQHVQVGGPPVFDAAGVIGRPSASAKRAWKVWAT